MPTLSVIMPVYNSEKFLKRSIDSVLNQTYRDLELILINDGSTDGSLSLCREYETKDNRVIVIDKKNEGAGPTRNKGIETAKGKYIAFPDSDDWLDLNAYEICVDKMEESGADLLVFGIRTHIYNDNTTTISDVKEEKITPVFYNNVSDCRKHWVELHKKCNMDSPCNKVYRREIIIKENVRYPDMRRMQDGVFNMRYYDKIASIVVIGNCLFNRTWHSDEFQSKKMPSNLIECGSTYRNTAVGFLKDWNCNDKDSVLFFNLKFVELLHTILFLYKLGDGSFKDIYSIVKKIVSDAEINLTIKDYIKAGGNVRKFDKLLTLKRSLLISIYLWFKNKRK